MQIQVVVLIITILWCCVACQSSGGECKFHIPHNGAQGTGIYSRGFCHFLGVPYARPIAAPWREFQVADGANLEDYPIKFWNFTQRAGNCTQYDFEERTIGGSDDCLYLNVYTQPWIDPQNPKAVLVWIHGGTFNFGSGYTDHADVPDAFVASNITVVTLNYRLGAMGFLYRVDEGIPENVGLLDQQEALRWIQHNIGHFGGDATRVTLMGWSAGSAAVSYHLYTPSNEGLFHAAIMMSGSFLNPWAYAPSPQECLVKLCNQMGISCNYPGYLREILTAAKLYKNLPFWITISFFGMPYPCFVPTGKLPQIVVKMKPPMDVPLMIGYTSHETLKLVDLNFMDTTGYDYTYPNAKQLNTIMDYLNFSLPEANQTDILVMADLIYGVVKFAEEYSKTAKSDTFLYKFSMPNAECHGDDLPFIFRENNDDGGLSKSSNNAKEITEENANLGTQMVRLWSNFVKFRKPTPVNDSLLNVKWNKFALNEGKLFLNIAQQLHMQNFVEDSSFSIWHGIYECLYYGNCISLPIFDTIPKH
uniref:Carboxylic ester hydrolase n=2 Tax=Lutzomyia longipalpis TaxID=7200 RepID=A0A1B0EXV4_LUTLO